MGDDETARSLHIKMDTWPQTGSSWSIDWGSTLSKIIDCSTSNENFVTCERDRPSYKTRHFVIMEAIFFTWELLPVDAKAVDWADPGFQKRDQVVGLLGRAWDINHPYITEVLV